MMITGALIHKTAHWIATYLARLLWLVLGIAVLLVGMLLLLRLEGRLDLVVDPTLQIETFGALGTHWLGRLHSLPIAGFESHITHLFTVTEMRVLSALQQLFRLGVVILLFGLLLLSISDYRRYWRHILLMSVFLIVMQTTPLFFMLGSGSSTPVMDLTKLSLVLLISLWTRPYLQLRDSASKPFLIAYASQTGSARQLATQLQQSIYHQADLRCMSKLTPQCLAQYDIACFVVSTCGKGEAPDSAITFMHSMQQISPLAQQPAFSVLALGDRHYADFCAFGHSLEQRLVEKGLRCIEPLVEVDQMDLRAVNGWWDKLSTYLGQASQPIEIAYEQFDVLQNHCLNPQQAHRHAHHLRLTKQKLEYQPGDVLAVKPRIQEAALLARLLKQGWAADTQVIYQGERVLLRAVLQQLDWTDQLADDPQQLIDQLKPIHERLYSIASCEDGQVDLLVRQHIRTDGSVGNASGYLCSLASGDQVDASVRAHPGFRLPGDVPLILIGAGTGIAPFIGFLAQKQQWGSKTENWLFFGEQYSQQDAYFADELEGFRQLRILTRLDCAWSREDGEYVQDKLRMHHLALYEWVLQKGAHVFVCGSQSGFGESVLQALEEIFPDDCLAGRLHTDLY
jgi:sulfite reductase (NADPH) flavoprotein alpha-component